MALLEKQRKYIFIFPLLIVIWGILIYSNSFKCSFHFDDINITKNIAVHNLSNIASIWAYGKSRFFLYLSFAVNYHFNKGDVFYYHLVNIIIHLISSISTFFLIYFTLKTPNLKERFAAQAALEIAMVGALIFLSHPVQTQAVTYIIQRAEALSAMFYISAILFYCIARLNYDKKSASHLIFYLIAVILGILCTFTKETSATLPIMIILYESLFFARQRTDFKSRFLYLLPFIALFLLSMAIFPSSIKQPGELPPPSVWTYLFTQFAVLVTYIRLLFIPVNQNLDYDFPLYKSLWAPVPLFSFLFLLFLILLSIYLLKKGQRNISFCILWFFITLSPTSSFISLPDVIFEHRLYPAVFGFAFFVSIALYELNQWIVLKLLPAKREKNLYFFWISSILIVLAFSWTAYERNFIWRDELTLWSDVVKKSPGKERPHLNLGSAYIQTGDYQKAIQYYERLLSQNKNFVRVYNELGLLYYRTEKIDQAIRHFETAIQLRPDYADSYDYLGIALFESGKIDESISAFNKAASVNPGHYRAHLHLAHVYLRLSKPKDAIFHFKKAIEIKPDYIDAYYQLGLLYKFCKDDKNAKEALKKVIELDPAGEMAETARVIIEKPYCPIRF